MSDTSPWRLLSFPAMATLPVLSEASVWTSPLTSTDTTTPCKRVDAQRFQCAPAEWAYVGTREIVVQGKSVECIWAHPLHDKLMTVTYPEVEPPPNDKRLVLEVAFHDAVLMDKSSPVIFTLTHGGATSSHTALQSRRGWQAFPIESAQLAAPLTLTLATTLAGRHHLCYRFTTTAASPREGTTP